MHLEILQPQDVDKQYVQGNRAFNALSIEIYINRAFNALLVGRQEAT